MSPAISSAEEFWNQQTEAISLFENFGEDKYVVTAGWNQFSDIPYYEGITGTAADIEGYIQVTRTTWRVRVLQHTYNPLT